MNRPPKSVTVSIILLSQFVDWAQRLLYQCLPEDTSPQWNEPDVEASIPTTQGPIARRLSGPILGLPWCHPPPGDLRLALRRLALQLREPGVYHDLSLRPALGRRAQERRGHRLSSQPRPPDALAVHRRIAVGPRAVFGRIDPSSGQPTGPPSAVLVFDPSAFPKKGTTSVVLQQHLQDGW
jgi:hypothetical protein